MQKKPWKTGIGPGPAPDTVRLFPAVRWHTDTDPLERCHDPLPLVHLNAVECVTAVLTHAFCDGLQPPGRRCEVLDRCREGDLPAPAMVCSEAEGMVGEREDGPAVEHPFRVLFSPRLHRHPGAARPGRKNDHAEEPGTGAPVEAVGHAVAAPGTGMSSRHQERVCSITVLISSGTGWERAIAIENIASSQFQRGRLKSRSLKRCRSAIFGSHP